MRGGECTPLYSHSKEWAPDDTALKGSAVPGPGFSLG
jgi:hypothetical protein